MRWPRRPSGLAVRFALLLVAALVAANVVAVLLLSTERARFQREARLAREAERIGALVGILNAVPPAQHDEIARVASGPFDRLSVDGTRRANDRPAPPGARRFAERLADELPPGTRLRLSEAQGRGGGRAHHRGRPARRMAVVSIGLSDGRWLNVVRLEGPGRRRLANLRGLFLVLGLSLATVLTVGLVFVGRLTRPISALRDAARRAGLGDRSARVPETGATELRELAAAFNTMQERIARFDGERTRLVAAVGHDLRTPLTSLRIRAEMVEDVATRTAMVRTIDDMRVMADGLLAFARGEADEPTERIDLAALATRLGAEVGIPVATVPAFVDGRPVALARAVRNLLDNALRYAGSADLSVGVAAGAAHVSVADDGPGIAPERLEEVMEPFARLETSRSAETGGAGLGLSIARQIANAHGGTLTLANRAGGGLCARITLPLASA